jgi:7-keto-8-aminopelargonate synthetase-like enzyme
MDKEKLLADLKKRDRDQRERRQAQGAVPVEPAVGPPAFDFSGLSAHKQLRMMRAAAEFAGIASPFFQVHEGRAGAMTTIGGREIVNFASYNYLGLNGHPEVSAAAKAAIDRYGMSASASRLVAGERPVHRELETCLARFLGTFVYSVGLPPALAAAAIAAIHLLQREPERLLRLRENAAFFLQCAKEAGLDTGEAINGSVIPVMVGDSLNAVMLSNNLFEKGFNALPIIFPAVAHKQARLRFFVTCEHTPEQIKSVVSATAQGLDELRKSPVTSRMTV